MNGLFTVVLTYVTYLRLNLGFTHTANDNIARAQHKQLELT